ncbi:MAG: hypothetical protein HFJ10_00005, partial [Lachnospiraceae bacterium]|nr:hypothetical protein [Lachnospiraceae bacterium]
PDSKNPDSDSDNEPGDGNTVDPEQSLKDLKISAQNELDDYLELKKSDIPDDKQLEVVNAVKVSKAAIDSCKSPQGVSDRLAEGKAKIDSYIPVPDEPEEPEPEPETTNNNIMVGGNWVTPVANGGQQVSVVLPVVNMGRTRVKNVVVTPQISDDASKWPFEIETSNYTQTIDRLPGTDDGGDDMERRRELTWILRTRKDAPGGYTPISFDVIFENDDHTLTTVVLTTYVNVKGTTGMSADGTASTPRVIVTGFSTDPEVVRAGETFTLTLHMQNTSKSTAVQNMLFDIQAASESTDTTYVAAAFLPTAGSSTIFVDRIGAGATKDISMEMEARSDLSQKPYVVNVQMNYEDENVKAYENTASVSIPVRQEARVDISSIEVMPESIEVGNEANVMFSVYNIGKTKLFNTSVKFISDSVSGGDTYLGNIDPGATANVDAYLSGAAATMDDGIVKIEISFEDEAGEKTTIEKEMTLFVSEMYFSDDMNMDDMYGEDMMEPQGGFKIWYVIVPVVIVVIGAVVFFVIRRKKKKKAQELLELESELEDLSEVDVTEANLIKTVEPEPKEEEESKEE